MSGRTQTLPKVVSSEPNRTIHIQEESLLFSLISSYICLFVPLLQFTCGYPALRGGMLFAKDQLCVAVTIVLHLVLYIGSSWSVLMGHWRFIEVR